MIPPQTPPDPFADELIEDKVLCDLDLRGRDLSNKIFRECRFSNISFAEARLRECRFEDCLVRLSDWTMAKVYGTAMRGVKFEGCKLMGIDWSDGHRALHEVNFAEANLSEADFSGSNLDRSRFQRTNLTRANLAGATNFLINPSENKTKGAIISLDAAVGIVSAMGMTVSGFGDAPQ